MIVRYTDHAANERTFLAWIRTALAVIAFGGILARSDLYHEASPRPNDVTADAGLVCVAFVIALFIAAYRRFLRTRATIGHDAAGAQPGGGLEGVLALSLAMVGAAFLATLVVGKPI
jgi:putative membrane protein